MLRMVTRRYRLLKKRSSDLGAVRMGQVAQKLLSSADEGDAPAEEDVRFSSQPSSPEEPSATQQPSDSEMTLR